MPIGRLAAVAALVFLLPSSALAAHGKAGLWSSTTTMSMPGMGPQSRSATYCMTQAEVNSDNPASNRNPNCTYSNVRVEGRSYSADMVCTGQLNATGHFAATYDSDTHFTATNTVVTNGMTMTNTIEGKWVRADCAGAEH